MQNPVHCHGNPEVLNYKQIQTKSWLVTSVFVNGSHVWNSNLNLRVTSSGMFAVASLQDLPGDCIIRNFNIHGV